MNTTNSRPGSFRQTNAFAMNYAVLFGLYWVVGLLCFVNSFSFSGASTGFVLVFVSVPFVGFWLLRRFRRRVCGGWLTFSRAYLFSLLLYFYASLLLAAACYVYFEFVDGGAFFNGYMAYLNSPELKELFASGGLEKATGGFSLADMKEMAGMLQELSPVAMAANVLDLSIFSGMLVSLPAALLAMRRSKF